MRYWFLILFTPYFLWKIWRAKRFYTKSIKNPNRYTDIQREKWVAKIVKIFFFLFKIKIVVKNIHLVPNRSCLFVSNHQSNFDSLAIFLSIFQKKQLGFIAKKELKKSFFFKNFLNLLDVLYIDRENPRDVIDIFDKARQLIINKKESILIFPEGTRSNSNKLGDFKPGAFKIATLAYCPIVPVCINESWKINLKNTKKTTITLKFLEPIMPATFAHRNTNQICDIVKQRIEKEII